MDDLENLKSWIGRAQIAGDDITPRLVAELNATLDRDAALPAPGSPAPALIHWCLGPQIVPASGIGPDGHPSRGGFLPPIPLPRRMWAGGRLVFHAPLLVGDKVEKHVTIHDLAVKHGRTGPLCFLSIRQEVFSPRGLAVEEYQDIVYRGADSDAAAPAAPPPPLPEPAWSRDMRASPVLLFRYSAVTFNGHRIHYDRAYTTEIEKYPGLLVHGPLQATLLVDFASTIKGTVPARFKFRAVQPLFDDVPFKLCATEQQDGLRLWIETPDRRATMQAEAGW